MKDKNFTKSQITAMDERKRARLINSLSGFKSANLIGTQDKFGNNNLAIVSSVVHIGSSPPLLGFVSRPNTVDRHTLENVLQSGFSLLTQSNLTLQEQHIKHQHGTLERSQSLMKQV